MWVLKDTYSLADLVEVTGAKRRSVQLWAERGVIRALAGTESAGTGVHRLFPRDEAIIACIIHAFAMRQMAIGELLRISEVVRFELRMERDAISGAVGGSGDTMLIYESWPTKGRPQHRIAMGPLGPLGEIHATNSRKPGSICMAIRLETYLGKME
jgi:hypothetical protein